MGSCPRKQTDVGEAPPVDDKVPCLYVRTLSGIGHTLLRHWRSLTPRQILGVPHTESETLILLGVGYFDQTIIHQVQGLNRIARITIKQSCLKEVRWRN